MHTKYYNTKGKEVPSVTTVMKVFYKEGLMEWANFIGRQGQDYKNTLSQKATLGTYVHELIEADLLNKQPEILQTLGVVKEAQTIANKFKCVKEDLVISNVQSELSLSSETYGGTLDLICDIQIDGKPVKILGDFKTSKTVYESQFIQLGAYLNLIKLNLPSIYKQIKYCMIFSITKEKVKVQYVTKANCEKYFTSLFLSLLDVYMTWQKIKNSTKLFSIKDY